MLPSLCDGCKKVVSQSMEGLHPYVSEVDACSVYTNTGWVERRGGCAFNATFDRRTKVKLNPLKASKRSRR
jgi:hypothetical protein